MGSSIKINSISIDLAGAANEIDMVKCDHFSIRGYVAETRERDHNKCWPFPEESVILVDQESYSLPTLSVPKFRWWRCMSCIRDIDAEGTKDCGLHPNSRSTKLDGNPSVILRQNKLNSLTTIDREKEKRTDIAGNAVEVNEAVNCKRSHKDDHRATTVRNKVKKLASPERVRNKRAKATDISSWKEKHNVGGQAVTTFGSSDIAGVVEDTPPKATKNHKDSLVLMECDNGSSDSINLAMTGLQRRKTRKVRRLSELLDQPETKTSGGGSDNIRKEEYSSSKRGRKRKVLPENNYVNRKVITVGATSENDSDQDYSTSTDSGFERDLIKGKQKNRRFQVVDEFVPSVPSQEGVGKNDADLSKSALSGPCPLSAQRTEKKLSLSKKKKNKPVLDNGKSTLISFSSQYTRDLLNDRLASEGYFRKPIPQVNDSRPVMSLHMPENDYVRSRDVEPNVRLGEFGSSSKPNTGGWLRTGVEDAVDFRSNNNLTDRLCLQHFNLRGTPSSTELSDRSSVLQKDASGADRKGKTVMFQEHHGEPKRQSHDRKENTPEDQNDDIPMEIVELLAKNQYERCLPDKEEDVANKQPSQETTHKPKNTLLIDLNETYDNGASLEDNNNNNNTPRPPKPFDSNARREEQHIKSLDFFPISQPYVPTPFGIFPPTQDNRASSNIRFSGHTCQWLGNVPTMATQPPYRVLRPCNTCQSVPHQYREVASHPIWASSMRPPPPQCRHHTPFSYNMDPSTQLGMLPQPPSDKNTWNLNFVAANEKQKCGSSELSFGCKHGGGVNNSRSVDAISSESSIPALHLLSLMDPRVGPNTPSDHQGNIKATKRHVPHVNQQPKERVEIQTGDSSKTTAYPTKQLPYDYHSKSFAPKSFPIGPPLRASSFSFQNAQAPWIHHQENKAKRKEPVYSNHDQGRFQLLGASDSMKLPLKFHMVDKEKKQNRKSESSSNNASTWPPKNSCGAIVCSVSRNPADFTIAEPGNVYMLTGESLKVRKRAAYKKKSSLFKQDALKQTKKPVHPVTENA